jgi:hypothetical protein
VRRSKDSLIKAAVGAALALTTGCGAMFNGPFQTVEVQTADPNAEILSNGTVIGKGKATLTGSAAMPPVVYVRDTSGGFARYEVESSVSGGIVVLDILCSLTIVGIAAPIADGMLDTFRSLDDPEGPIAIPAVAKRPARTIEYAKESAPNAAMYRP